MLHPELSLPIRPLRERFLALAEIIVRQEVAGLKPWGAGGLVFRWAPRNQASFSDPIALTRIDLTHVPTKDSRFKVISSEFEILGDDGMTLQVSRQMKEQDFPNDEWNQMVFERFASSYENHQHTECETEQQADAPKALAEYQGYRVVDKRSR